MVEGLQNLDKRDQTCTYSSWNKILHELFLGTMIFNVVQS